MVVLEASAVEASVVLALLTVGAAMAGEGIDHGERGGGFDHRHELMRN